MEVRAARKDLVVMHGKMRVEFTGHALKTAMRRSVQPARFTTFADNKAGNIGSRITNDLTQTPPRTRDEKRCACQLRNSLRQFDFIHQRKAWARFKFPTQTNRNV